VERVKNSVAATLAQVARKHEIIQIIRDGKGVAPPVARATSRHALDMKNLH